MVFLSVQLTQTSAEDLGRYQLNMVDRVQQFCSRLVQLVYIFPQTVIDTELIVNIT
jgi:hypothetical protein